MFTLVPLKDVGEVELRLDCEIKDWNEPIACVNSEFLIQKNTKWKKDNALLIVSIS